MQVQEHSETGQEPWNLWEIQSPPNCTVLVVVTSDVIAGVNDIKNTLFAALTTFKNLKAFHKEAGILSRYLYKCKRIFRHDKGLQQLVKINQALQRYCKLNVSGIISNLKEFFPSKIAAGNTQCYLPTRQMLLFVLLRLLSMSKILVRIIDLSKDAGRYIYARLCLGWSKSYMILSLAVASRILACAKYLLLNAIKWYNCLRANASVLKGTADFVPNYEFPKKLEDFVGQVDLRVPKTVSDIDKIFEIIDLTGGNDSGDDDVIITSEIFLKTVFVDDDSENDEVIIEEQPKTARKRNREKDDGITIVYEKNRTPRSQSFTEKVTLAQDKGEIVSSRKRRKKNFH